MEDERNNLLGLEDGHVARLNYSIRDDSDIYGPYVLLDSLQPINQFLREVLL